MNVAQTRMRVEYGTDKTVVLNMAQTRRRDEHGTDKTVKARLWS